MGSPLQAALRTCRAVEVVSDIDIVLLLGGEAGLALAGHDVTTETNCAAACVTSLEEAKAFAGRAAFPSHGLIVIAAPNSRPEPALGMT
jgi:hypothetical protein